MALPVCPHCQQPLPPGDAPRGAPLTCPACGREVPVPGGPLAGSPDDRAVTLLPSQDETTLTGAHQPASPDGETTAAWRRLLDADAAGRYVHSGAIAHGGMGEILLCVDRNIRRPVAMKRILDAVAGDPARRARFVEEAQVTGQLEHPNIVPVHELDRAPDGSLYFTMKLVKGRSLADLLKSMRAAEAGASQKSSEGGAGGTSSTEGFPPHSLSDLLQIFLKVCDGVAFAHSRGVVHRDLKPSNIMVGAYGEVLVMDWGLAKIVGREDIRADDLVTSDRVESGATYTLDGAAIGTPAYMPPEQANGELDKINQRSDIYSLGAILYELLTFERPVEGDTPLVVLANAARGRIVPPEQRTPHRPVPRELSAIAMKCLHKLRSRRYQSVPDLQRDIALFLEGRSVTAAPDTFAQAAVKLVKRNKGISGSIATAAAILIAVTAFFLVRLTRQRDAARAARARAERERVAAQEARDAQLATAMAASGQLARQAVRAATEGRMIEADARADAALRILPTGPWGHYALGAVAHERKDLAVAREHLETALRHDPKHEPSRLLLASVRAAAGDLERWEQMAAGAEQVDDWNALLAAGETLLSAQRYPQAVAVLSRAKSLLADNAAAPESVVTKVSAELRRAQACVQTEGLWEKLRDLPVVEQKWRLIGTLRKIYGGRPEHLRIRVETSEGTLVGLEIRGGGHRVCFIDPIRDLPLQHLKLPFNYFENLSPLRGMPLRSLELDSCSTLSDLGPLKGMALQHLNIKRTAVSDLEPLRGMPLWHLNCDGAPIRDFTPLHDSPVVFLNCANLTFSRHDTAAAAAPGSQGRDRQRGDTVANHNDETREPLAGSADDWAVTLPAARAEQSTLRAEGKRAPSSVEAPLRAAGAEAGRYVKQTTGQFL
ncbi:MAG: protein kinase domain-containing protein [Planctomycetota bacterium]